ncbi:MAG: circadian clock KaiB family protein [Solirubrobacteraceae bacterium]
MTAARDEDRRELTLFVSGASDLSARAIADARALCDIHLGGGYALSVVDVHEDSAAVLSHGVLAAPTLVRSRPLPLRRFIGDLSQTHDVLLKLEIAPHVAD